MNAQISRSAIAASGMKPANMGWSWGRLPYTDSSLSTPKRAAIPPRAADINGDGVINTLDPGKELASWTL